MTVITDEDADILEAIQEGHFSLDEHNAVVNAAVALVAHWASFDAHAAMDSPFGEVLTKAVVRLGRVTHPAA